MGCLLWGLGGKLTSYNGTALYVHTYITYIDPYNTLPYHTVSISNVNPYPGLICLVKYLYLYFLGIGPILHTVYELIIQILRFFFFFFFFNCSGLNCSNSIRSWQRNNFVANLWPVLVIIFHVRTTYNFSTGFDAVGLQWHWLASLNWVNIGLNNYITLILLQTIFF